MSDRPSLIVILTEGIRGHLFQSRGLARWISLRSGASICEFNVPVLSGLRRFLSLKLSARFLPAADRKKVLSWLKGAGGISLFDSVRSRLEAEGLSGEDCLIISAGSSTASFNLALGRILGARTCVLMTPSVLGTSPFDFAVVPRHDAPRGRSNVLPTLGAPNSIIREDLSENSRLLTERFPFSCGDSEREIWGLLIGGDDANYVIDSQWIEGKVTFLLDMADSDNVDVYITTSRRTSAEAEKKLSEAVRGHGNVRMLLLASRDSYNPVPGMLGICDRIFCTEDSVSMISESATSGAQVHLLRVGRRGGIRSILQALTARLVGMKILPQSRLWGVPRFDGMIDFFKKDGLIVEMPLRVSEWRDFIRQERMRPVEYNEARRAADWILSRWSS